MMQRLPPEIANLVDRGDREALENLAADVIRRAATLDKLCEVLELEAETLNARTRDLEMRENDLLRASLEMRGRKGAFSGCK